MSTSKSFEFVVLRGILDDSKYDMISLLIPGPTMECEGKRTSSTILSWNLNYETHYSGEDEETTYEYVCALVKSVIDEEYMEFVSCASEQLMIPLDKIIDDCEKFNKRKYDELCKTGYNVDLLETGGKHYIVYSQILPILTPIITDCCGIKTIDELDIEQFNAVNTFIHIIATSFVHPDDYIRWFKHLRHSRRQIEAHVKYKHVRTNAYYTYMYISRVKDARSLTNYSGEIPVYESDYDEDKAQCNLRCPSAVCSIKGALYCCKFGVNRKIILPEKDGHYITIETLSKGKKKEA